MPDRCLTQEQVRERSIKIDDKCDCRHAMTHYIGGKDMDGQVYLNKKS